MVVLVEFTFSKRSYDEFDITHFYVANILGIFTVLLLAICCYKQRSKRTFIPQSVYLMINRQFLLGISPIEPGTMNPFAQRQRRKIYHRLLVKQQSSEKCNSFKNDVNERRDPENKPSVKMTKSNVVLLE